MLRQVFDAKFQIDVPIGWLSVDIEEVAERCSLRLERAWIDGLGPSRGVVVEAETGRIFALIALDALQRHGPQLEVIAEGKDIVAFGVDALMDETVHALSLSHQDVMRRNHQAGDVARRLMGRRQ